MRRSYRRTLRVLFFALALLLILPGHALAATIDEVEARQEELKKENEALEEKLEALRADEEKALEYQAAVEEKISLTEQKIDAARESIQVMDREISELEERLRVSKEKYQDTIDLFAQRLTALYKCGNITTLEILLNSESFSDFTMKSELLNCVAQHDQQLLDKIEEYAEKTQEDREEVRQMRETEAQLKKELEADQEDLQDLHDENSALIAQLEGQQAQAQETIRQNEEEDEQLEAELQELIRQKNEEEERRKQQQNNGGAVVPTAPGIDGFSPCWPLPGYGLGNITGHFGDVYSFDSGPHKGLDIGVPYGTPIVAAESGQVLSAQYHSSWGNNVLIWHNQTFSTRYAHMSSMAVSAGDYVEKGQVIGYVGDTGFAYGYHLHFEVYYNGVRVDPDPYLGI